MTTTAPIAQHDPRIPVDLQQVFLKSNRGEEVTSAPRSAFRVFKRSFKWLPRRNKKKNKQAAVVSSPDTLKTIRSLDDSDSDEQQLGDMNKTTNIPMILEDIFMPSSNKASSFKQQEQTSRLAAWKKLFTGKDTTTQQGSPPRRRLFQNKESTQSYALAGMTDLSVTDYTDYLDPTEILSASSPSLQVVKSMVSPQSYVDSMIYELGYSTRRYKSLTTAYYNRSTALQQASFRGHLIDIAKTGNARALRAHLQCGLSPNPSNAYGESLVHKICRMGRARLLRVLVEDCHVDVRVTDEHGRTPLHEACAANSLECFELLCEQDVRMLYLGDHLNMVPLQFVPKNSWMDWIVFLEAKKDEYWPQGVFQRGQEEPAPLLALQPPHSRQQQDPPNALPLDVASRVASGELKPELAQEEKNRQLAQRPMLGQLIANLDNLDDLSDLDDDSYFSDSDTSNDNDVSMASDYDDDDDDDDNMSDGISEVDDDDDDNSEVSNSMDLKAMGEAMMVLGISPRSSLEVNDTSS